MKNTPPLAASSISQEALDSLLITAAGSPRGEAPDKNGRTQTVAELLELGADVDAANYNGTTALMIAALNGHTEIVAALLSCERIDVNAANSNGSTALIFAAQNGYTEIVARLLDRGAGVNAAESDGYTALMSAAHNGHTEIVARLLDRGAGVNAAESDGSTALMIAAQNGRTETVAELLAQGADVNAAKSNGSTALMIAARNGYTEIVARLLDRGADVNTATSYGYTALMFATLNGYTETISALLSRDGVDWQIVQNQLSHPELRYLNKEVSVLLAVTLPEGELRNSIITRFNQRNPSNAIRQENNDILGAGIEAYKNLKDLKSWHVRYLTDSKDVAEDEVEILADQRFFYLLNHQDLRQEAFARNDLVAGLVDESTSLAIHSGFGDEEALDPVRGLSPEDFYKLTKEIIDKSRDEDGIPRLEALSLVAALRKDKKDQASASPATTMHRGSVAPIASPQKGGCCVVS